MSVLEVTGLDVAYGGVRAVRDLSLVVAEGEIVGLIGPSGAGKTTTVLAIMGAVERRAGSVRLRGVELSRRRPEDVVRAGVSLVPERRHIFPALTVEENLRLGLMGRRTRAGIDGDLEWVAGLFPVAREFAARPAGSLSGGQQQQLAIARALVARPDVLLLDEPTLGLSPTVIADVWSTLGHIRASGTAVLVVEQRARMTIELADRTYVLGNGELRLELAYGDGGDDERLERAYFG